jgi:hypothetical protein
MRVLKEYLKELKKSKRQKVSHEEPDPVVHSDDVEILLVSGSSTKKSITLKHLESDLDADRIDDINADLIKSLFIAIEQKNVSNRQRALAFRCVQKCATYPELRDLLFDQGVANLILNGTHSSKSEIRDATIDTLCAITDFRFGAGGSKCQIKQPLLEPIVPKLPWIVDIGTDHRVICKGCLGVYSISSMRYHYGTNTRKAACKVWYQRPLEKNTNQFFKVRKAYLDEHPELKPYTPTTTRKRRRNSYDAQDDDDEFADDI